MTETEQRYARYMLQCEDAELPLIMAAKAKGGRRTGVSEKQRFWKSAQEPHEKNELCLISWKSKFNDEYMVDFAWWYDGKWEGEAEFDPPDFWAPIPNPREANRET